MESAKTLRFPRPATWEVASLTVEDAHQVLLEHYDREQVPLRRYLSFLGMDVESARETVQESFLKLHEHLLAGGDRTNLRAWLYRVAHNLARNAQSSFRASRTDLLADVSVAGEPAADEASAEDELLEKERMTRLRDAINQLSPAQKECLVLRSQGFKYREIAEVLSLSVSTVAENVQRGLDKVKELL